MKALSEQAGVERAVFQHWMYGGSRDKKTAILANCLQLAGALSLLCDGKHAHKPWGISFDKRWNFATAEECEYPEVLCSRVAAVLNMTMNGSRPALLAVELAAPDAPGPGGTRTPIVQDEGSSDEAQASAEAGDLVANADPAPDSVEPDLPLPPARLPQPAHQRVSDKRAHMEWLAVGRQRAKRGHEVVPEYREIIASEEPIAASPSASPSRDHSGSMTAHWYQVGRCRFALRDLQGPRQRK